MMGRRFDQLSANGLQIRPAKHGWREGRKKQGFNPVAAEQAIPGHHGTGLAGPLVSSPEGWQPQADSGGAFSRKKRADLAISP